MSNTKSNIERILKEEFFQNNKLINCISDQISDKINKKKKLLERNITIAEIVFNQ